MISENGFKAGAGQPAMLRIALLGGFRVWIGPDLIPEAAWRRRKVQALVKRLALAPGHRLHREQLMDGLWPELEIEAARNNLRQALHLARRILEKEPNSGNQYLSDHNTWLSLCPEGQVWVDVEAFESAAATARRSGDPAAYQEALELYTGELLPEDRYEDWVAPRRESLRVLHLSLLSELGKLMEGRGDIEGATDIFGQVIAVDPTIEEAHQALMRLYAIAGKRNMALQQYRRLREILETELAVGPDQASQDLYDDILSGRFQAQPASPGLPSAVSKESPNQTQIQASPSGRPREARSVDGRGDLLQGNLSTPLTSFIGREKEIAEIQETLSRSRLVTLTGAGGSGKTRLALQIAKKLVGEYPDGVWVTELAGLSDPGLVAQAVARTLGIQEQAGQPLVETLGLALRRRRLLLVLDNCEHLLDACASLARGCYRPARACASWRPAGKPLESRARRCGRCPACLYSTNTLP